MKTPAEYEAEIADKDRMIARLKEQLTKALEAVAETFESATTEE